MFRRTCTAFVELIDDESGQSITEYGAVIAFVGVLIAMAFGLAHGGLFGSISESYSSVESGLNAMNEYATSTT